MTYMTLNLRAYTAEQYAEDIATILPSALPELRSIGRMTTCAHCGSAHGGICFAIHKCIEDGVTTDVEVVAVCDSCAADGLMPPQQWAYVGETSGLFVAEENWAEFARTLRFLCASAFGEGGRGE